MGLLYKIRYYGREIVLPSKEIRRVVKGALAGRSFSSITDLGAGTLWWSKWLAETFDIPVKACDTLYGSEKNRPNNTDPRITLYENFHETISKTDGVLFVCDVIHHLPPDFWRSIMPLVTDLYSIVIIKDIDAEHKFGNFMNRLHDFVINGEKIHNVLPSDMEKWLKSSGFAVDREYIPKLWYPHFIIVAVKEPKELN
jgi:hypothetical protein